MRFLTVRNIYKIPFLRCVILPLAVYLCDLWNTYFQVYADMAKLFVIGLTLPVTSVNCERGISTYNLIKTDHRSQLHVSSMQHLLMLSLEAPGISDFDYDTAFQRWLTQTDR